MSLQLLAKQMEAKGRKGDSMLVHMTPSEVAGLQKLAESAGGSLSVNPETGLVEANFLKRMLPTLVGLGVGAATMNPMLGAAAGAAVGGYQAKRNDQDVLLGAAMGGLGGYGGASLAGGLTSAGAGAAQQAAMTTAPQEIAAQNLAAAEASKQFVAQPALTQMGQGISALGKEAGRDLFMQGVGGAGGLAKAAGMAATPLMAAGKRPGDPEVDDELYSYTYDVGRTGAENTPSGSSAERLYFDGRFSPVRKIRAQDYAAKGGLMSLAEGGETAAAAEAAAPTASEAALAYLMGERSSSAPTRSPLIDAQMMQGRPASTAQAPVVGSDNMYAFDPATGTFLRNPNVPGASMSGSPVGASFAGGDSYTQPSTPFDTMSPAQQAAYYAENPTMAAITRAGQMAFSFSPFAKAQEFMSPGFAQEQRDIASGNYSGYDDSPPDMSDFETPSYDGSDIGGLFAKGGIASLAKGGMASGGFVVPADVVSALGNGSTDAGLRKLSAMMGDVKPIKGKGDGLSDSIPTNIDGKQPARVADGEAYIDPKTVKRLGGAKKLYAMMDKIRAQAHGKTSQQRKVNPAKVMA
jgi:hypothetical protein